MILHTIHSLIEDVESFDVAVINIKLICLHQSIRKNLICSFSSEIIKVVVIMRLL